MSRWYEISVTIKNYKAGRLKQIEQACREEWSFAPEDFIRERTDPRKRRYDQLTATAQGNLCLGEQEHELANRLVRGIWKANGGYCYVVVHATYLENLPYETYTFDEDEFKFMTGC